VLVSLAQQTMHVYRNGILIGRSSISSGSKGNSTPPGVFNILEKKETHYSKTYDKRNLRGQQSVNIVGLFTGGSITTWAEIRGAQSSPEVTDAKAFAGCWINLTFCILGRGVELTIVPLILALNNQVKIYANLLCDVGVRYPAAFAVTAPVT